MEHMLIFYITFLFSFYCGDTSYELVVSTCAQISLKLNNTLRH